MESARPDYLTCYGLDAIIPGGAVGMSEVNFDEDEELLPIKLSDLNGDLQEDDEDDNMDSKGGSPNVVNGYSEADMENATGAKVSKEKGTASRKSTENGILTNGRKKSIKKTPIQSEQTPTALPAKRGRSLQINRKQNTTVKRNSRGNSRVKTEPLSPRAMVATEELNPILGASDSIADMNVITEAINRPFKRRLSDGLGGSPSKVGRGPGRAGIRRKVA